MIAMTRVRQTVEACRQALCLLRAHRLLWLLLAGAAVVIGISVFVPDKVARRLTGDDLFGLPAYLLVFQFGLPTILSYFGLWAVHDEISDRSVIHVFAQPVPRPCLLLGKWLAVTLVGALAGALICGAYWLALAVPDRPWRRGLAPDADVLLAFMQAVALAAPGYAAVGALCGACFRRPLIAAILFVVGWEVAVSNVPPRAGIRDLTIADPVRRFLVDRIGEPTGELGDVLQGSLAGQGAEGLREPLAAVAWFTAVVLAAATLIYSRREYDARARD
ncbi:MAG: ABC transporter permease [Planctomycetota bacterium]|nr:ABC transporter permease [Planctomycetota bacterium]MDA0934751.1 ABC transporter permease [Planctomycetota bacterium]MDA1222497.1 ABC transporter permease [Planctomycetota bacterium]